MGRTLHTQYTQTHLTKIVHFVVPWAAEKKNSQKYRLVLTKPKFERPRFNQTTLRTTHTNTHQHTPTHTNTHQHTPTHTNTHQHTPTHTNNTHQHTPTHTNTHAPTHTNTRTNTHQHTTHQHTTHQHQHTTTHKTTQTGKKITSLRPGLGKKMPSQKYRLVLTKPKNSNGRVSNQTSLRTTPWHVTWVPLGTVGGDVPSACPASAANKHVPGIEGYTERPLAERTDGRSTPSAAATLRQRGGRNGCSTISATCPRS